MQKTLIVIRHGESEWNATPRPDREEWYFRQLEKDEQDTHNNKLLGMLLLLISLFLFLFYFLKQQ